LALQTQPPRPDAPARGAADPLQQPGWIDGTRRVVDSLQNDPTVVAAERRLRCTCPCGLDIFTCRTTDFTCSYSPVLHDEVMELVKAGVDVDGVVAAFVAKHGERILLAPEARGFGVLGYILPGVAILASAGALTWVLIRRGRRPAPERGPNPPPPPLPAASQGEMARLDRALADLES